MQAPATRWSGRAAPGGVFIHQELLGAAQGSLRGARGAREGKEEKSYIIRLHLYCQLSYFLSRGTI